MSIQLFVVPVHQSPSSKPDWSGIQDKVDRQHVFKCLNKSVKSESKVQFKPRSRAERPRQVCEYQAPCVSSYRTLKDELSGTQQRQNPQR